MTAMDSGSTGTGIISYERTPNPRSLKFTGDGVRFCLGGLHSFGSPAEAVGNQLGEALFAIAEVTNVLILPDFATVTVASATSWTDCLARVLGVLHDFSEHP